MSEPPPFRRSGTFVHRDLFIEGVRSRLDRLGGGTCVWERSEAGEVGRWTGFGARLELVVGPKGWSCRADFPEGAPLPRGLLEKMLDEKLAQLSRL